MDHLPTIEDPAIPPLKVPCLCEPNDYDRKGFLGFPERNGWTIDRSLGPVLTYEKDVTPPPAKVAALLQTWLFFGLLHNILELAGVNVDLEEFAQWTGDQHLVSTLSLQKYLDQWLSRESDPNPTTRTQRQRLLVPIFSEINHFFIDFLDHPREWRFSLPQSVLLSILILGETLGNAARFIWYLPAKDSPLSSSGLFRRQNPVKDMLTETGWCLNEITMLNDIVDYTGLYIASMLKRSLSSRRSHATCSTQQCNANQVNESTYETKHTHDCHDPSECPHIFADDQKVSTILQGGNIPIIKIISSSTYTEGLELKVVPSSSAYVAISHVWAHGLGNPSTNSLPRCQILRLERLTRELFVSLSRFVQPALWIDTLCIPVHESLRDKRKLAISKLAETYSKADQCLIIDADLIRASLNCSRTEIATRVLCCGWMRRLWTLQEAVLTDDRPNCKKLQIQFREGSIAFNALLQTNLRSLYNSESALSALFSRLPQFGSPADNFRTLTHALQYRTTSRSEDEPVCLASILNLDMQKVLGASSRMQAFYSSLKELPSDVLFHKGENLPVDGYRWAPKSLLSESKSKVGVSPSNCPVATVSDHGLHVRFPGFILTDIERPVDPGAGFCFRKAANSESMQKLAPFLDDWQVDYMKPKSLWRMGKKRKEFGASITQTEHPAIIVNPTSTTEVVVVSIIREEDIIFCRYIRRASLFKASINELKRAETNRSLITAREVPWNQRWCVG